MCPCTQILQLYCTKGSFLRFQLALTSFQPLYVLVFDLRQELESPATESVWEGGSDKKKRILADHELTNLEMVNRWLHMIAMVTNAVAAARCESLLEVALLRIV